MDRLIQRGEIWSYEFKAPDKRRPVLVLTRSKAIPLLNTVIVASITSTIHGSAGEVVVGIEQGLKNTSAINLDNVQTVEKSKLKKHSEKVLAKLWKDEDDDVWNSYL